MTQHEKTASQYSITILAMVAKDLRKNLKSQIVGTDEHARLMAFEKEINKRKRALEI